VQLDLLRVGLLSGGPKSYGHHATTRGESESSRADDASGVRPELPGEPHVALVGHEVRPDTRTTGRLVPHAVPSLFWRCEPDRLPITGIAIPTVHHRPPSN